MSRNGQWIKRRENESECPGMLGLILRWNTSINWAEWKMKKRRLYRKNRERNQKIRYREKSRG